VRQLTEASSSNVDDGARFYSVSTEPNLANVAAMAGQQSPRMDDARFYRRVISVQEPGAPHGRGSALLLTGNEGECV
jgi:hypothetical protein